MADYEIKNGWILCKIAVKDIKRDEMGIDELEWERFAVKISTIRSFRESADDGEYAGTCTVDSSGDFSTITIPYDALIKLLVNDKIKLDD